MVFLDRIKKFVTGLNTIGKYHGKDPLYLEYHGAKTVHTFVSLNLCVYAALLDRTSIYFLNFQLNHSFACELICLCKNTMLHLPKHSITSCLRLQQVGFHQETTQQIGFHSSGRLSSRTTHHVGCHQGQYLIHNANNSVVLENSGSTLGLNGPWKTSLELCYR